MIWDLDINQNRSEFSIGSFTKRNHAIDFSGETIITENDLEMELYENVDKRSYGVEMSAKFNVPALHSYIFGNAFLMKAEKELNGEMTEDEQLPKVVLNTGLYFDYTGLMPIFFVITPVHIQITDL